MRRTWGWALLLGAGCLHRPPLTRLDAKTPIGLVILVDRREGVAADGAPAEVREAIERELVRRNLDGEAVPAGTVAQLTRTQDPHTRVELLGKALGPDRPFLLVQLKTVYFDEFEGGYKWNVMGQYAVGLGNSSAELTEAAQQTSAFLTQSFEGEREALQQGAGAIADRIGILLDDHFSGQKGVRSAPREAAPSPVEGSGVPSAWLTRPLYFVLLDRFAPSEGKSSQVNRQDPDFWHGGTLATLRQHLDALQALGVGTLWLSPLSRCRERKQGPFGPSHCYWVEDLTAFEPRFGTFEELRGLRDELHARGMRLVLDVVLNHVAPDSPLFAQHPDWFHPKRALIDFSDRDQLERAWLGGLPDLAQERPEVADYLIGATVDWVRRIQPDGLRMDAVKHVPATFWARLNTELKARFPGLLVIGEDLEFDPLRLADTAARGGFPAAFDFPLQSALLGGLCGAGPLGAIGARLGFDRFDAPGFTWVTLLDNHDLPRLLSSCHEDAPAAEEALAVLFALRGLPALTYGVEAGLSGAADPLNRGDLEFPVRSPFREQIARLSALRAAHPALSIGETFVTQASGDALGLVRAAPGEVEWLSLARGPAPALPWAGRWQWLWQETAGGVAMALAVAPLDEAGQLALRQLAEGRRGLRSVRFQAVDAPALAPGESLAIVGAAPELGDWDPQKGVPIGSAPVALAPNGAYELKLAVRRGDGSVRWQPGANAVVYVPAGAGLATLSVVWGCDHNQSCRG